MNGCDRGENARDARNNIQGILGNITGFLAYYVIDTGEGELATVSVFETKTGEKESNRVAAGWVKETLSGGLLGPVEITSGEVVAHKAK